MNESHGIGWRLVLAAFLFLICCLVVWALIPLYRPAGLLVGFGLPAAAAWIVATIAIRRGLVGRGSYAAAWAIYAVAGTIFWEIVWDFHPILFFWKPLMCDAFQGPSSPCAAAEYLREQSFWMPFGFMVLLLPHSALSGLVFVARSFLPDYRRTLSE